MIKSRKFASQFAAALTLATLAGTSAFAADRQPNDNAWRGSEHRTEREAAGLREHARESSERAGAAAEQQRERATTQQEFRNNGRTENRSYDRNNNRGTYDRNGNRGSYDNRGSYNNRSYGNREPYRISGRVSRLERFGGGYRVYVAGARYPFFVPEARFRLFPFRVGVNINIGGYYNDAGYYDYYDVGPYGGSVVAAGELRGTVDRVDFRNGTMVVRDDYNGNFVTVLLRGDRRLGDVRPGDFVTLSGDYRRGVFEAYRLDAIDSGYYRR